MGESRGLLNRSAVTRLQVRVLFSPPLILILMLIILLMGCCNPDKVVVSIKPFYQSQNIDLKGYDCDCDAEIDYWQHYRNDVEFGSRIYTKGYNTTKCDMKLKK